MLQKCSLSCLLVTSNAA